MYNTVGYTPEIYRNITWLDVGSVCASFHVVNNAEDGRKVLGLTSTWTIVRRGNRTVEVVVGGRQKVCYSALYILFYVLEWQLASRY